MTDLEIWLVIGLLTVATLIDRTAFWVIGHHIELPKRVQEALHYAPSCALIAIIIPDLLIENNQIAIGIANPKLIGGFAATLFFFWKRDMLLTILFGMAIFTAARLLVW